MGYPAAWPGGPPIAAIMAQQEAQEAQAAALYRQRKAFLLLLCARSSEFAAWEASGRVGLAKES